MVSYDLKTSVSLRTIYYYQTFNLKTCLLIIDIDNLAFTLSYSENIINKLFNTSTGSLLYFFLRKNKFLPVHKQGYALLGRSMHYGTIGETIR